MSAFGSSTDSGKSLSKSPSPPPRKDGLTYEEGAERQGQLLNQYYIVDNVEHEAPPPPAALPAKLIPKSRKGKQRAAPLTSKPASELAAKAKPAVQRLSSSSGSSSSPVTPTRRSDRIKTKRKNFDDVIDETPVRPLAKKAKLQPGKIVGADDQDAPKFDKTGLVRGTGDGGSAPGPINKPAPKPPGTAAPRSKKAKSGPKTDKSAATPQSPINPTQQDQAAGKEAAVPKGTGKTRSKKAKAVQPTEDEDADTTSNDYGSEDTNATASNSGSQKDSKYCGISSGMGTASNKPGDATLQEPWHCGNRGCVSGQTWYDRDSHARKSISQYFGRNKKETSAIDPEVWHNLCRKDYQVSKYNADKVGPKSSSQWQLGLIRAQLWRIKLWRPEAKFRVQLTKNMLARKSDWETFKRRNNGNMAKARKDFAKKYPVKEPKEGKPVIVTPEQAFLDLAEHFDETFCGDNKDFDDLDAIFAWIEQQLNNDVIDHLPPMEFLVKENQAGDTETEPADNYVMWAEAEDAQAEAEDALEEEADQEAQNNGQSQVVLDSSNQAAQSSTTATSIPQQALENLTDDSDGAGDALLNAVGKAIEDIDSDEGAVTDSESDDQADDDVPALPSTPPQRRVNSDLRWVGEPWDGKPRSTTVGMLMRPLKRKYNETGSDDDDATVIVPVKRSKKAKTS